MYRFRLGMTIIFNHINVKNKLVKIDVVKLKRNQIIQICLYRLIYALDAVTINTEIYFSERKFSII